MRERASGCREQCEAVGLRVFTAAEARSAESDVLRQCGIRGARGPARHPVPGYRIRRLESRSHPLHHGRYDSSF